MTPPERARGLLALATNDGATREEQRTAAHALAQLIVKHGLRLVGGGGSPDPPDPPWHTPRTDRPKPTPEPMPYVVTPAYPAAPDGWQLMNVLRGPVACSKCLTGVITARASYAWRSPTGLLYCGTCATDLRLAKIPIPKVHIPKGVPGMWER